MKKKSKKVTEEVVETEPMATDEEVVATKPSDSGRTGIMQHMILGTLRTGKGIGNLFWYGMAILCFIAAMISFLIGFVFSFFTITGVMLLIGAVFLWWIATKFK